MAILSPLKAQPIYAVQGDISFCNLYQTCLKETTKDKESLLGIFDFNRCGDNNLFCDAVMQAIFEARLMEYPKALTGDIESQILTSFLRGYCSVRSFSEEQKNWYPYLYAVTDAFWSANIKWNEDSLMNAFKNGDMEKVHRWLEVIWQRLMSLKRPPVNL